jgi:hypothetical protein
MAADQFDASLILTIFAFIGLHVTLCYGTYVINADGLALNSPLGRWQILWREISSAQFSDMGVMLFLGGNKRFVLASPSWWPRTCRSEGLRFVSEQLMLRNIDPTPSAMADYRWMKNTKAKDH